MNQNQRDADMSLAETWAPLGWLCALCAPAQRAALHGRDKVVLSPACRCQAHDNEVGSGDQRLPTPGDLGTKNLGMGGDQHSEQRRHRKRSGSLQPIVIQRAQAWESDAPGGVPALPLAGK